ncbi:MAG: hypothetical protein SF052_10540, partial [Bacteroidia bacterium]|nr:hypothetical protein [Bacteroidia bacterium]
MKKREAAHHDATDIAAPKESLGPSGPMPSAPNHVSQTPSPFQGRDIGSHRRPLNFFSLAM